MKLSWWAKDVWRSWRMTHKYDLLDYDWGVVLAALWVLPLAVLFGLGMLLTAPVRSAWHLYRYPDLAKKIYGGPTQ